MSGGWKVWCLTLSYTAIRQVPVEELLDNLAGLQLDEAEEDAAFEQGADGAASEADGSKADASADVADMVE